MALKSTALVAPTAPVSTLTPGETGATLGAIGAKDGGVHASNPFCFRVFGDAPLPEGLSEGLSDHRLSVFEGNGTREIFDSCDADESPVVLSFTFEVDGVARTVDFK
ncbi:uncharacterized protein SPSK_05686 [Sporothrix schenckii 1099-18]|uniref:Uncharacterized protein n=1 Tax=Sporothrix schenckii 1099-18 TaxID=1397361 RepID=A0A0F2LSX0_SPOSC|nr:uncharacterized protein SPSK_05686 [Sporothrix schenckii 1099-18]KJR80572.1 hypothetical protein SPSK_05686 [Sporothrix schenckii 1099-18]